MNHYGTFLFFLCIPLFLKSEYSWERSSAESLVQGGIQALYNYDFDNAIKQTVDWYLKNKNWWKPLADEKMLHPQPWTLSW